ncbi:MAG: hypothetical protein D6690_16985 [Nitrospirae bacterium]|nr:MAG: hypothetical protein D6690_16985 [Nitrospirota bacterium]
MDEPSYPVLEALQMVARFVSGVMVLLLLAAVYVSIVNLQVRWIAIGVGVGCAIFALALMTYAEILDIFMDIAHDSWRTAEAMEATQKRLASILFALRDSQTK